MSSSTRRTSRTSKTLPASPRRSSNSSGATGNERITMDERQRHDEGMTVRRAVLGDAHVDRALANKNTFNAEFQELITRYAWGEVWARPGLSRHTRSLLTIAMMVALNRAE